MTFNGRPAPAAETHWIIARPAFPASWVVVAILGGAGVIFGLVVAGFAPTTGLVLMAAGLLVALSPLLFRVDAVAERFTGWTAPVLEITPWPLRLGSPATVVYRRRPLRAGVLNTLAGGPTVEVALVCQELVRYTVGSSTRTDTNEVARLRASTPAEVVGADTLAGKIGPTGVAVGSGAGPAVEAVFQLTIPVDLGGPTLALTHNRIDWWLETQLGAPFGKRTSAKVELIVPGAIDRNAVLGEGGDTGSGRRDNRDWTDGLGSDPGAAE